MATTGPYILHKSTQLCFAVRSKVNFDLINPSLLGSKLGVKFSFPNGAYTLPPRINLKSLSTAMKLFCEKLRIERERTLITKQSGKQQRRRSLHRHHGLKSRPRDRHDADELENSAENSFETRKCTSDAVLLSVGGFFWARERITEEDLIKCTENLTTEENENREQDCSAKPWEKLTEQCQLSVWRRHMDCGIYEYKVFGSFCDINARSFYFTQVDTEYRKMWDQYALKLDIIDRDPTGDCEVLHWIMKYPYPLSSRDYVFVRKSKVDEKSKKMVLVSKATSHPRCPEKGDHVRVTEYGSQMVISPHRTFDEDGLDFVLSYYDNPKTTIPSACTSFATSSGIPSFIKKLHAAAMEVQSSQSMCTYSVLHQTSLTNY